MLNIQFIKKHHQHKLQRVIPPRVQGECLHQLKEGKHHKHKVQRSGCKVQRSGHKVQRSGPAAALVGTGCSNNCNMQVQPPPPPPTMQIWPTRHDAAITATCVKAKLVGWMVGPASRKLQWLLHHAVLVKRLTYFIMYINYKRWKLVRSEEHSLPHFEDRMHWTESDPCWLWWCKDICHFTEMRHIQRHTYVHTMGDTIIAHDHEGDHVEHYASVPQVHS